MLCWHSFCGNSDGEQYHQNQQNEQSQKSHDGSGNPGPDLGQE
jgi:hypothetical protein